MTHFNTCTVKYNDIDQRTYTFKVHTSLALQKDDYCVVLNNKGKPQVVQVVEVHDQPQIDPQAPYEYKWIIDIVDFTQYNLMQEQSNDDDE